MRNQGPTSSNAGGESITMRLGPVPVLRQ
jgi:hypothetical protein